MTDEVPEFGTREEFLAWARKNWPPDPQFCAEHWATFALRERTGGMLLSIMYLTDVVFFDDELARRAGGDPATAMKLASPYCCHYGEEVYERMLAEIDAPEEWLYDCQLDPRPGGPDRKCRGVFHEACRIAREEREG